MSEKPLDERAAIVALQCALDESHADYAALLTRCEAAEARLAKVERLLQECFDARATTPSIGLVYRVGHYLNHRNDATQEPPR